MDFDTVGKNTGFFSFTKTIADLAANRQFTKGYRDLVTKGNNGGRFDEDTFIWHSLSAISETVGTTIYENVLNYIDNVSNIDTCKVRALASMSKILGITNNGILETIDRMPSDVLRFLDVFSINKSYLTNPTLLRTELLYDLMRYVNDDTNYRLTVLSAHQAAISSLSGVPSSDIEIAPNIPEGVFRSFVFNAFYDLLSSKIFATYDGLPMDQSRISSLTSADNNYSVYQNLVDRYNGKPPYYGSKNALGRNTSDPYCFYDSLDLDSTWRSQIDSLKNAYGLETFDPYTIADRIYAGEMSIDDFSGPKLLVLQQVFKNRDAQKFSNDPLTKYAYYTEKSVVEYLHYVNSQYLYGKTGSYDLLSSSEIYDVDQNYMVLDKYHLSNNWITDSIIDPNGQDLNVRTEVLSSVSGILTDMCNAIVGIREKLKTQAQRNYMRGSFLLISYVVSEYLKKNLPLQYPELLTYLSNYYYLKGEKNPANQSDWAVDIVEYIDTTEYYNLSTDTSKYALNGNTVNLPFWKDEDAGIAGVGIALKDIERFYLSTLNIKTVASETSSFLNVIYDLGADRGYVDKRTSSDIVVGAVYDNLQEDVDMGLMSQSRFDAISSYQREIFLNYAGTKVGFDPYYNWKNIAHPSYQIHPYLPRFIVRTSIVNAIKNTFLTDTNLDLMLAIKTPELSSILGECGQILNIWDRNATTFHGWKTRYENNTHDQITDYGRVSPLQHYDGVFYPSAIEEYISAYVDSDQTSFNELIYSVANLSSGQKISDHFRNRMLLCNDFDPDTMNDIGMFDDVFEYSKTLLCIELSIALEQQEIEPDEKVIKKLSSDAESLISMGPRRTYYEKWYSHLNLQKTNCEKIALQLSVFKDDIYDLYRNRGLEEETYDIYKYGLDRYSNSYLLYKKCHLKDSYTDKRNKKGEMWFRFNSHPIGFPLFLGSPYISGDYLSNASQVNTENMYRDFAELLSSSQERRLSNLVFDFDFTNDYRALVLAYDERESIRDYQKIEKFLIASPYESPATYDEYGNRLLDFQLKTYTSRVGGYQRDSFLSDFVFQGMFQDVRHIQGIWSKVNSEDPEENRIELARIRFPDEVAASRATFTTYLSDANSNHYCLNITTRLADLQSIRVGFANDLYTLATLTEAEAPNISSMTYIGVNTNITSSDSELDSIRDNIYGRNRDYFLSANDIEGDTTSIDRLSHYLTLVSFDRTHFDGNAGTPPGILGRRIDAKNYNLNPDASYIPLYSGLLGFSRIWATDFYKSKRLQSIELMGYSFNALKDLIDDFADGIVEDEDGISSNTDVTELLNSVFRVYEQYENGKEFFLASRNPILRKNSDNNYVWNISLSSLVGLNTEEYRIQLYNVTRGATCPILNCMLSDITSSVMYLSSGTIADRYYLSNEYMLPNMEEVVGTPDIFEYSFNPNFASGKSNYIMNIESIKPDAVYDSGNQMLSILFKSQYADRNYIIDRDELLAIVYSPNLHWMENYHFMVPHDIWPYLSVDDSVYGDKQREYQLGENKYIYTTSSDYESFITTPGSISDISSTILSNFQSCDQIPAISSGTYTFKISEQANVRGIKYPGGNVFDELEKVFRSVGTTTGDLSNVFTLNNTYIFELDRPKYFADLIGRVRLGVYADNDECVRVFEDYISSMYSVSKYKAEILGYAHFFENYTNIQIPLSLSDETILSDYPLTAGGPKCFTLTSVDSSYTPVETELSSVEGNERTWWMCEKVDDMQPGDEIDYTIDYDVTEKDLKDFLKLYVNYRVNHENNEIELYFNYNNYFCTPYSYRNKFGEFVPMYKEGTFLHLNSGETGYLNVIVQIKYYNHLGSVCAVKDIPMLAYKIRNVSDDKPKFVILRSWTLTPELVQSIKGPPINDLSATLQVMDNDIYSSLEGSPLSSYMNEDFTTDRDLTVKATYRIIDVGDIGSSNFTLVYEYSNPDIEFNPMWTKNYNPGSRFTLNKSGSVDVGISGIEFQACFTIKAGAVIDEDTSTIYIPLDAINFKAKNSVLEDIKTLRVVGGGITLHFGKSIEKYRLLGREKEGKDWNGFILGENGRVIRMYQNRKEL